MVILALIQRNNKDDISLDSRQGWLYYGYINLDQDNSNGNISLD